MPKMWSGYIRTLVWTLSLLLSIQTEHAGATFTLRAHFKSYYSTLHRKFNGFCCNTESVCMSAGTDCNNRFNFCLHSASANDDNCTFGEFQTTYISDDDKQFISGQNLDTDTLNPLVFRGDTWPGTAELIVRVEDELTGTEVMSLVTEFRISVIINHNPVDMTTSTVPLTIYPDPRAQGKLIAFTFELLCDDHYFGQYCEVFCAPRNDELGHFSCDQNGEIFCLHGFTAPLTNCTECLLAEGCSPIGGYCNSTQHCICVAEFSGENCDIDLNVCRTNGTVCQNGGICNYSPAATDRFICTCPEGYGGKYCELDLDVCGHITPCANSVNCTNSAPNNYTCTCIEGYEGTNCLQETDECINHLCRNGAICKDLYLDYECECRLSFTGRYCEEEIDGCIGDPCLNNGTCMNNLGDFVCQCAKGFHGQNCADIVPFSNSDVNRVAPIIGGVISSVMLFLLVVILLGILVYTLKQRKQRKLLTNERKKAEDPRADVISQQTLNVDNPNYGNIGSVTHNRVNRKIVTDDVERFDNPIYAQANAPLATDNDEIYSRLDSRIGIVPGVPLTSPGGDLLSSYSEYSTLNDSIRTQSTLISSTRDHHYERVDRETQTMKSRPSLDGGSDHVYSTLGRSIPKFEDPSPFASRECTPTDPLGDDYDYGCSSTGPYGSIQSSTTSPEVQPNKKKLTITESESSAYYCEVAPTPLSTSVVSNSSSAMHEYDSVEIGIYKNTVLGTKNSTGTMERDTVADEIKPNLYDDIFI